MECILKVATVEKIMKEVPREGVVRERLRHSVSQTCCSSKRTGPDQLSYLPG